MSHSEQLLRTLLAVASGALASAAAAGCGGQSSSSGGGGGAAGESTTGGASGSVAAGGAAPTGGMSTGGMLTGGMSSGGFVCEDGPALELCKTLDELEDYVANYPGEAQKPPRQEFTVCPPRDIVWDPNTCCNPADRGPEQRGLLCCYGFCELRSCCGRAFSVDERARVAPTARRGDWLLGVLRDNAEGQGGALGADAARAIGGLWLRDAQMEHASIASFARFTLELLALGAPANLLEAAQHATVRRDRARSALLRCGIALLALADRPCAARARRRGATHVARGRGRRCNARGRRRRDHCRAGCGRAACSLHGRVDCSRPRAHCRRRSAARSARVRLRRVGTLRGRRRNPERRRARACRRYRAGRAACRNVR